VKSVENGKDANRVSLSMAFSMLS